MKLNSRDKMSEELKMERKMLDIALKHKKLLRRLE
jgi:hypothetical protein